MKKKEIKKQICSHCGQIIDEDILVTHRAKQLRRDGLPSLAKLIVQAHKLSKHP